MDLRPGDIVLIEVRFHQAEGAKVRPVIVVLDSDDEDFVPVPVTSRAAWPISRWRSLIGTRLV